MKKSIFLPILLLACSSQPEPIQPETTRSYPAFQLGSRVQLVSGTTAKIINCWDCGRYDFGPFYHVIEETGDGRREVIIDEASILWHK